MAITQSVPLEEIRTQTLRGTALRIQTICKPRRALRGTSPATPWSQTPSLYDQGNQCLVVVCEPRSVHFVMADLGDEHTCSLHSTGCRLHIRSDPGLVTGGERGFWWLLKWVENLVISCLSVTEGQQGQG
jgi:hypothetical protein